MSLPIFPLNTVLFPGALLPLRVFEQRYLKMLQNRIANDPVFGVALIEPCARFSVEPTFQRIGTTARLISIDALDDGTFDIVVRGGERVVLGPGDWTLGYAVADADILPDRQFDQRNALAELRQARAMYDTYIALVARLTGGSTPSREIALDAGVGSFVIAARLPLQTGQQQQVLEDRDPVSRSRSLVVTLRREISLLRRAGIVGLPIRSPGQRFALN